MKDKYLIHACPQRTWYVREYLVPSMKAQGISERDIIVYTDIKKLGNLGAYLDSAKLVVGNPGGTWHLQDDVVISSDFRAMTEKYNYPIVCGFCNDYSVSSPGFGPAVQMWYSFPCMRISNKILAEFVEWMKKPDIQNNFKPYIEAKKYDDSFFRYFMVKEKSSTVILNLAPNIVDNIDYLLGGSLINTKRSESININAKYFDEPDILEQLKVELEIRKDCLHL